MAKPDVRYASQSNTVYAMGMIGALVYYISTASSILDGLFGIFQAIVWPAFLVYEAMHALGM